MVAAAAEYERTLIVERTRAGLDRARRQGKRLGRPRVSPLSPATAAAEVERGASIRVAARQHKVGAETLRRHMRGAA